MELFQKYSNKYLINKTDFKKLNIDFNLQESDKNPVIVIYIDGLNLFIRNFFSTYGTMEDSNNHDVGGLLNSLRIIFGIVQYYEKFFKGRVFYNIVFEKGRSHSHKKINKDYKQNRDIDMDYLKEYDYDRFQKEMNQKENFTYQISQLKSILKSFSSQINFIELFNTEGDFGVRYLLEKYEEKFNDDYNLIHLIFSNDNDFKQLLTNEVERNIFIYDFQFKRIISKLNFHKYYKHSPESILYTKIFVGDSSDNIEGLPNVGKVTGEKYYQQLKESLSPFLNQDDFYEKIYNQVDNTKLSNIHKKKIKDNQDLIKNNFKMINLIDIDNVVKMISLSSVTEINDRFKEYIEQRKKIDKKFKIGIIKKLKEYKMDEFDLFDAFLFRYNEVSTINI